MSGRDDDEHVGYPMNHLFRRRNGDADDLVSASGVSPDDSDVIPVDLAAIAADDALLNALGRTDVVRDDTDTDAELARVLVAWRREIDTEPVGQLVDIDTAVATVNAARRSATRRHPVLAPVAAAAAVLVVAFAGISLVAKSAEPGDQLFALTKVLYAQYAQSVEAAKKVETQLSQAEQALREGNTLEARKSLEIARQQLPVVDAAEGREQLDSEHRQLMEKLDEELGAQSTSVPTSTTPSSEVPPVQPVPPSPSPAPPTSTTTSPPLSSSTDTSPPTSPSPSSTSTVAAEPQVETRPAEPAPREGERSSPPAETEPGR